jgi:hypothetical protein
MLSVIDDLCMPAYINMCRFHWILLNIQVDAGLVEIMDSLDRDPEKFESLIYMLQR